MRFDRADIAAIRKYARPFHMSRNAPCLCGSGLKFKRCCQGACQTSGHLAAYFAARNAGNDQVALHEIRAHVSWYRIMHAQHTVPTLQAAQSIGDRYLSLDINSLADCLRALIRAHQRLGLHDALAAALPTFEHAINDPRWTPKYHLLLVLEALGEDWNEGRAGAVLSRLYSSPFTIDDFELLTMYLDFLGESFPTAVKERIARRLMEMATRPVDKLHYGAAAELFRLMMNDEEGVALRLREHIEAFEAAMVGGEPTAEDAYWHAEAYLQLACVDPSEESFDRAEKFAEKLLAYPMQDAGKATNYKRLGEVGKARGQYARAAAHFQTAASFEDHDGNLALAAECLFRAGDKPVAALLINRIDVDAMPPAYRLDFALTYPLFALDSGSKEELARARQMLIAAHFQESWFQDQQMRALRAVESRLSGAAANLSQLPGEPIYVRALRFLNRYSDLKPNWMGFGVNLNAVIERVLKAGEAAHADSHTLKD